jgi:hypothetical protein
MTNARAELLAWILASLLAALAVSPALSQATGPMDRDRQPRSETEGQSRDNLSDRLNRSDGVIRPPGGVDPQMQVPPPEQGSRTPVIPPPGTPGGDRTIEPK